jgi:hypothetical protein
MQARTWILCASIALPLAGCSWSRFDDVENNAPVVILNKPSKMHGGFGASVAAASELDDDESRVMVSGANGHNIASMFKLGTGTDPVVDAQDTGSCDQDPGNCFLADQVAGLGIADLGEATPRHMCFVFGFNTVESTFGLQERCIDTTEAQLKIPASVEQKVIKDEIIAQADAPEAPIAMATDKDEAAALVLGASKQQLAWFYEPATITSPRRKNPPHELIPPGTPDTDFGTSVASVRLGNDKRIMAVGAPTSGHVWLFQGYGADTDIGKPIGCIGGPKSFGMTLATGDVNNDGVDELVVADGTNVTVFSGTAFAALGPSTDITCSLAALPPGAILASFDCGSTGTIGGCPAGFGTSLAVGDLDGDHDGEVLVGAPDMNVRGTGSGGAVLVYDLEAPDILKVSDELFLSSAKQGDRLGSSLTTARIKTPTERDVVVAGAPGSGRVGVFYCSKLLAAGAGGARCQ